MEDKVVAKFILNPDEEHVKKIREAIERKKKSMEKDIVLVFYQRIITRILSVTARNISPQANVNVVSI